jgi:hypothetical protein
VSAAKRRRARQITRIVRMDMQHCRDVYRGRWDGTHRGLIAAMMALGQAMTRRGLRDRGMAAIDASRRAAGWVQL